MIPLSLAALLRDAGLTWRPAPGDAFVVPDRDMDDDIFVLSDMTVTVHDLPDASVIGFNGTTEWALDDVEKDEVVWLPREDQLRNLLGSSFRRLERVSDGYLVLSSVNGTERTFHADQPEEAYGRALLHLLMLING